MIASLDVMVQNWTTGIAYLMLTQEDMDWVFVDAVDSTNTYLTQAYATGQREGVVAVVAQTQTHGRGRAGRSWVSTSGGSLCLSVGLPLPSVTLPFLPVCVGVGVAQCLQSLGVDVALKWPNDFLIQGRKLGGVLCEGVQGPRSAFTVVGIGLNIQPIALSDDCSGLPPTSLADHWRGVKPLPSAQQLAQRLVPCVVSVIELALRSGLEGVAPWFARRDAFVGRGVTVFDAGQVLMHGVALGLAPDGAYRIQTEAGERAVYVGDVSLRMSGHDSVE